MYIKIYILYIFNVIYCTVCDAELSRETIVVDALGHSFTNYVSDNNATCTTDGTKTSKCDRCDVKDTVVDTDSKLGHNYNAVVTAPTCTEQGYTTYTCARCSDTYVDNYVDALGHTEGEIVVENNVAPTCTADGSYDNVTRCGNCETELSRETVVVPATGHSFDEWTVSKAPTCTEAGEERRDCANCDHYETKELAALGHDYSNGGSCALCGKLSDGAVTGIVAGSAVAVGGGGFSLFWFVIRKKRFKK